MSTADSGSHIAPPAGTGNAGGRFEGHVGGFYLLALLSFGEPRGLVGATTRRVQFQGAVAGRPLDDIVVHAVDADGLPAVLEIQAKRTMDFTVSDGEFADVVSRIWKAAQKPEFDTTRYELAVATSRTSTRIERSCQEVLHWARQVSNGADFASRLGKEGFSSKGMRDFAAAFRKHLAGVGAPTDDDAVWRLLRRFQILVFDFEAPGSDYAHRARERARMVLAPDQAVRAAELWPLLAAEAETMATASGDADHATLVGSLHSKYGFRFGPRIDLRQAHARLTEDARHALDGISDQVGGVQLSRTDIVSQAYTALDQARIVQIVGAGGVGKSAILRSLAERLQPEGTIVVLRPGRIVPGGWRQFAHAIDCRITRDELFTELGCGGGATLFVDSIDQIDDPREWETVADFLRGVLANPGWRAAVTASVGVGDWQRRLPDGSRKAMVSVDVSEINDAETAVLAEGNPTLAVLLGNTHPARGIARNLFYLSRMVELSVGLDQEGIGIASEIDLARTWWRYGGGRSEDGKLTRLRVLRALGAEVISHPGKVAFRTDAHDSVAVTALLRLDSLREDRPGSTVAFRHDVLRDWTVGFLLDEEPERLPAIAMGAPIPGGLSRALEIAARLAVEGDATGARWQALMRTVEKENCHGSWRRPVLLALPRAEYAPALFERLQGFLLEADGRRLGEVIRLMIAVESEPLAKRLAQLQSDIAIPDGAGSLRLPTGSGWGWLVMWILTHIAEIPSALIPDIARLFQFWLFATHAQSELLPINARIVELLYDWLTRIEDAIRPMIVRDASQLPKVDLNFPHLRTVRDDVRATFFAFCRLKPSLAGQYLAGLDPVAVRHHEMQDILRAPGQLVKAAPAALVDFALAALIQKPDPNDMYRSRGNRFGPFGVQDGLFLPASPGQGPFFELLEHAPAEGLRLIRGLIEHAMDWQREDYDSDGQSFPTVPVPFPEGTRTFQGGFGTFQWARGNSPSVIVGSALMALEAWAHRQIESGHPFKEVLNDVLGPNGSSVAFLAVAVDLALSHWAVAREVAWPFMAVPEFIQFDDARYNRHTTGVDRYLASEVEPDGWRVKRADLDARPSRRARLSDQMGYFAFYAAPERLAEVRDALALARDRIAALPDDGDPLNGLRAIAERTWRMTDAANWPLTKVVMPDGSEIEAHQYQPAPEETRALMRLGIVPSRTCTN